MGCVEASTSRSAHSHHFTNNLITQFPINIALTLFLLPLDHQLALKENPNQHFLSQFSSI